MTDTERLLLSDIKRDYEKNILNKAGKAKAENSFELFMYDQLNNFKDYEKKVYEKVNEIYKKIGWDKYQYFDAINSMWTTFHYVTYWVIDNCNDCKDIQKPSNKRSFAEDYRNNRNNARKLAHAVLKEFPQFDELAALTHCAANFMPCMDRFFNSLKYSTSNDFLPEFADRINAEEKYERYKSWLMKNRDNFCLADYYDVEGENIKFQPLFNGKSSLHENRVPKNEEEIKNRLDEIITRIKNRARYMAEIIEKT